MGWPFLWAISILRNENEKGAFFRGPFFYGQQGLQIPEFRHRILHSLFR